LKTKRKNFAAGKAREVGSRQVITAFLKEIIIGRSIMNHEEREAARDILKYFQNRPNVKHTAEGIAKYWLFNQRLEEKLEIVMSAIDFLVKARFLEEVQKEDRQSYYRINREKMDAIPQAIQRLSDL
jgi:hypothetical protein